MPAMIGSPGQSPECYTAGDIAPKTWRLAENLPAAFVLEPRPEHDTYLQLPKVLLPAEQAEELIDIHTCLSSSHYPRHLDAAASAAVEAALTADHLDVQIRHELLARANTCWLRATHIQEKFNTHPGTLEALIEDSAPLRFEAQRAFMPIYEDMINGGVSEMSLSVAFENLLRIAQLSSVKLAIAEKELDHEAIADLRGFGHEANALLIFALSGSATRIAVPAFARADSGYYNPEQSHDIQLIQQKWGNLLRITPIEIKAAPSKRDRERYLALVIRGKMHMTPIHSHHPTEMLRTITALYEGTATKRQARELRAVSETVNNLVSDYKKKTALGSHALLKSCTKFRQEQILVA